MGDEVFEVGAVAGGQAGSGDHGVNAQSPQASGGIEETGGFGGLIFVEGDDGVEECTHCGDLGRSDRSADELEP